MVDITPKFVKDWAERVAVTGVEAAVAYGITQGAGWPTWAWIPLMAGLAAAKGWLAKHFGSPDSASVVE